MKLKDRSFKPHGENNSAHKLTWEDVRTIRARFAQNNVTQTALAHEFEISISQISEIVNNKSWKE